MDPRSEVERKFEADKVSLKDYHDFVASLTGERVKPGKTCYMEKYKAVEGRDTYYVINGRPLRFREGGDREAELTYKERKSSSSIADRIEINLPFKHGANNEDVHVLLESIGAEKDFVIDKVSYIYHLVGEAKTKERHSQYHATLALYDVVDEAGETRRFLEVEIEASSKVSVGVGLKVLDRWTKLIKNRLDVKGPVNQSLYEIYTKRKTP